MGNVFPRTCAQCGAPLPRPEAYCPFCQHLQTPLFADPMQLEACRNFLLAMNEALDFLPPGPGWGLLLLWFGTPLASLLASIIFIKGNGGWLAGILIGVLEFGILLLVVGGLREKIRLQQYDRVVQPELTKFMQNEAIRKEELILLVHQDESLRKSSLAGYLEKPTHNGQPA